jgi:hypothetical protein
MSAQVRLDAVIVAADRFLASPDIGFRSPVTGASCVLSSRSQFEPLRGRRGDSADCCHSCRGQALQFWAVNFAAHSPEDSQRDRKCRSARLERTVSKGVFQSRRVRMRVAMAP